MILELPAGCPVVTDSGGRQWLMVDHIRKTGTALHTVETVNIGGTFYDVVGYSPKREAVWLQPILDEGISERLEQEWEEYVERLGDN